MAIEYMTVSDGRVRLSVAIATGGGKTRLRLSRCPDCKPLSAYLFFNSGSVQTALLADGECELPGELQPCALALVRADDVAAHSPICGRRSGCAFGAEAIKARTRLMHRPPEARDTAPSEEPAAALPPKSQGGGAGPANKRLARRTRTAVHRKNQPASAARAGASGAASQRSATDEGGVAPGGHPHVSAVLSGILQKADELFGDASPEHRLKPPPLPAEGGKVPHGAGGREPQSPPGAAKPSDGQRAPEPLAVRPGEHRRAALPQGEGAQPLGEQRILNPFFRRFPNSSWKRVGYAPGMYYLEGVVRGERGEYTVTAVPADRTRPRRGNGFAELVRSDEGVAYYIRLSGRR
ncbi:MAG: hypothetical protein Q4B99_06135 [Clostridia bacterium]|nr:hypothetical protein [Clostridia bacterium]